MDIELQAKLLRLKGYLNEINHISYTYSQIGRAHSMADLDTAKALQLIKVYENLLSQVRNLVSDYERPRMDQTP